MTTIPVVFQVSFFLHYIFSEDFEATLFFQNYPKNGIISLGFKKLSFYFFSILERRSRFLLRKGFFSFYHDFFVYFTMPAHGWKIALKNVWLIMLTEALWGRGKSRHGWVFQSTLNQK